MGEVTFLGRGSTPILSQMDQRAPHTSQTLSSDLLGLGVRAGDVLLLHASNRSLGYVAGGVQAVVEALLAVLGPQGTLVVPTHTGTTRIRPAGNTHPSRSHGGR